LTQLTLDLGTKPVNVRCKLCRMEYIPSNQEDNALHKKFHAQYLSSISGIDVPRSFTEGLGDAIVWTGPGSAMVVAIRRKHKLARRKLAFRCLAVAEQELGALTTREDMLWSTDADRAQQDRYAVFLYIQRQKCVGVCLAERIRGAYVVLPRQDRPFQDVRGMSDVSSAASITISTESHAAILGISRIWISPSHRREGLARRLLDSARADFLYGVSIPRDMVAFSQPTDSGALLARKWFGKENGWSVYVE
ncbi:hypothetical protein K402DRAFT_309220, partial [Aulographum hederae CBS 113979]